MENEVTIYHYGVKGMKWGVRRDFRVLANNRRNKAIKEAKRDYNLGAAFVASPALGPLIGGAYGANIAANLGRQWITQHIIDRVS